MREEEKRERKRREGGRGRRRERRDEKGRRERREQEEKREKIFFIMYSRKVQVKYIADTRLQERNQEKHMVIWLWVIMATWLRYQSILHCGKV